MGEGGGVSKVYTFIDFFNHSLSRTFINHSIKPTLFHSILLFRSVPSQILHQTVIGWLMSCDFILNISLVQTVEKLPRRKMCAGLMCPHQLNNICIIMYHVKEKVVSLMPSNSLNKTHGHIDSKVFSPMVSTL